jgi:asparagine synthase (glutamine-hydrolysing)
MFNKVQKRGPDTSTYLEINQKYQIKIGFHRLAIHDQSQNGNQPFVYSDSLRTIYVICNGEIYNYQQLIEEYKLDVKSKSDCEVILHLYQRLGYESLGELLQGEYAYTIIDVTQEEIQVICSRDRFGIRPLYYQTFDSGLLVASSLKGLDKQNTSHYIEPSRYHVFTFSETDTMKEEIISYDQTTNYQLNNIHEDIRSSFTNAVQQRLSSDRPVGCLLSGGLDSSLVAGIASKLLAKEGKQLKTFSIGMHGSTDIKFANIVAEHIQSDHTVIHFTPEEGLHAIKYVIQTIESYDITTVRASVGQYLLGKYISQNTDIKVILNGDGSDEVCCGYLMFHNAPNTEEAIKAGEDLVKEIHMFDVLRVDRALSEHGLEARVPFLDYKFVDTYRSADPELRVPRSSELLGISNKIEKALLREAFVTEHIIPDVVIKRMKEAFSDGVSSMEKSWYQIIQEYIDTIVSDDEFNTHREKYTHNKPPTKEAYYYRKIFEEYYGKDNVYTITHFWLPKWSNLTEPSARALKVYETNVETNTLLE